MLYGQEKKPLPYIIGLMNMILHGIEKPNFLHKNSLEDDPMSFEEKDKHDIILANPPFGAAEDKSVLDKYEIITRETASMFLQHFMSKLKVNGRAAIVIKNTFLSNDDNATVALRKKLLENFNLYTILDVPSGVFTAGVRTVILFFEKGESTKNIWYYQLNLNRNLGKTNPLNDDDLKEFLTLQKTKEISDNSWIVNIKDINKNLDLSVKNPNRSDEVIHRKPKDILADIEALDKDIKKDVDSIKKFLL